MCLPRSYRSTFVPFIPSSSSAFLPGSFLLPPEQPTLHFPGLSSLFQCLVLGDFASLLLLSHPFLLPALGLTHFKEETAACAVWCYPLIPLTFPTRTLNSFPCAAAPFPVLCSAALRILSGKSPCYTRPWLPCSRRILSQGICAFPWALLWLPFRPSAAPSQRSRPPLLVIFSSKTFPWMRISFWMRIQSSKNKSTGSLGQRRPVNAAGDPAWGLPQVLSLRHWCPWSPLPGTLELLWEGREPPAPWDWGWVALPRAVLSPPLARGAPLWMSRKPGEAVSWWWC